MYQEQTRIAGLDSPSAPTEFAECQPSGATSSSTATSTSPAFDQTVHGHWHKSIAQSSDAPGSSASQAADRNVVSMDAAGANLNVPQPADPDAKHNTESPNATSSAAIASTPASANSTTTSTLETRSS